MSIDIATLEREYNIVIFDGVCNFCDRSVQFILKHDNKDRYRFVPFQQPIGEMLLKKYGIDPVTIDSIVLIENQQAHNKSTAILKITRCMSGLWPLMYAFIILPKWFRDPIYEWIGRNRYRWFGKKESCMIPSPEVRAKFLF
ncbi:MAG: thiol-disulfide oxidoreductase DCC family protein [Flavobacteriaceae bacterium]|nr:thiol-disulfide oxidoreductase DCC family protein [Flavobacteriaceae bacterium]